MERIEINGLRLFAHHGVLEAERRVGNIFIVDIILRCDLSAAMSSDCVADTVNYAEIVEIVRREMAVPSDLLEHVAKRIRDAVCRRFPSVTGGEIRVAKPAPPIAGIRLESVAVATTW